MSKASERLDAIDEDVTLTNQRIDRVAKAVDINADDFDSRARVLSLRLSDAETRLGNLGSLAAWGRASIDGLRDEFKACTDRGGELHERISEIESWADDLVAVQRENADATNANDDRVFERLAEVEQLASLTAQRVLKAESRMALAATVAADLDSHLALIEKGEAAATHDRRLETERYSGLSRRLFALESIKNRGFGARLRWLFFGE